jgi:hypothetical protein
MYFAPMKEVCKLSHVLIFITTGLFVLFITLHFIGYLLQENSILNYKVILVVLASLYAQAFLLVLYNTANSCGGVYKAPNPDGFQGKFTHHLHQETHNSPV